MKKIVLLALLVLVIGSCSMEKIVMKSSHHPELEVQQSAKFKEANDYQQDFLYLSELVKESYPYYEQDFEGDYEAESQRVFEKLAKVKEEYEFDFEVKIFLAKLHNNHTYLLSESSEIFPLYIRLFDGELIICNVGSHLDSNLIGQTVVSINDVPAQQLLDYSLAVSNGETPFGDSLSASNVFYNSSFYKYYGIINNKNELHLKVKESDQVFKIFLSTSKEQKWKKWRKNTNETYQLTRRSDKGYDYEILEDKKFAYFQFNIFMDKVTMLDGIGTYIRKPYQGLVRSYVKYQYRRRSKGKSATSFVQKGTEDLKTYLAEMFEEIESKGVETLVIDLRNNGGGDLEVGKYITAYLTKKQDLKDYGEGLKISNSTKVIFKETYHLLDSLYQKKYGKSIPNDVFTEEALAADYATKDFYKRQKNPSSIYYMKPSINHFEGKIYVISGAKTGSAASMFTVLMKDNGLAEIIGVSPSNRPTGSTVVLPLELPNTKRRVSVSTHFYTRPDSSKHTAPYLEIDQYFPVTKDDYFESRDRAIEYVILQIEKKNPPAQQQ